MTSDIQFTDDSVIVTGENLEIQSQVKVANHFKAFVITGYERFANPAYVWMKAPGVVLSNPDADPGNDQTPRNVALAHSTGDKLVINSGEGYSGGVEIEGKAKLDDEVTVEGKATFNDEVILQKGLRTDEEIVVGSLASPNVKRPPNAPKIIRLTIKNDTILVDQQRSNEPLDLVAEIKALRNDIRELQEKVGLLDASRRETDQVIRDVADVKARLVRIVGS